MCIPSTKTLNETQILETKTPRPTCVHTLYNNTNKKTSRFVFKLPNLCLYIPSTKKHKINTKARFQIAQSYLCTYPLQQQKHNHSGSSPKCPVLNVYIPCTISQKNRKLSKYSVLHVYIPSTTK